jgi:hypothetical protein
VALGEPNGTSAAHVSDEDMHAAILRWVPSPHGPTPKSREVTNADTPAPSTPAPAPEPSRRRSKEDCPGCAGGLVGLVDGTCKDCYDDLLNTWTIQALGNDAPRSLARLRAALRLPEVAELETIAVAVESEIPVWDRARADAQELLGKLNAVRADLLETRSELQAVKDQRDLAHERLELARNALRLDEYFGPGEAGEDIAPRILERIEATKLSWHALHADLTKTQRYADQIAANNVDLLGTLAKPAPLTEEDLERRFAALVESRKLRAIALGEVTHA